MMKLYKWLIFSVLALVLSACGGGGSTGSVSGYPVNKFLTNFYSNPHPILLSDSNNIYTLNGSVISGPNTSQVNFTGWINSYSNVVTSVNISSGGSKYTSPTVTFSPPNSTICINASFNPCIQATGTVTINAAGTITAIYVTNPGYGYAVNTCGLPYVDPSSCAVTTVTINDGGVLGTGAAATAALGVGDMMSVSSVTMGTLMPGQLVLGNGVTTNTVILAQATGTLGGAGNYIVADAAPANVPQLVPSEPMYTGLTTSAPTFESQAAYTSVQNLTLTMNGTALSHAQSTSFFNIGPYNLLGETDGISFSDVYTNQASFPIATAIGGSGTLPNAIEYAYGTNNALANIQTTWVLNNGLTSNNAYLCITKVKTSLGTSTQTSETTCLLTDINGNLVTGAGNITYKSSATGNVTLTSN